MTCLEAQSNIMAFIEKKLPDDVIPDFVKHMRYCKNCREELEIYYTLIVGMHQVDNNQELSQNFAKACSAAEFAMVLRKSDYASGLTAQGVVDYMEQNNVDNSELFELIYKYMQNGTGSEASYW